MEAPPELQRLTDYPRMKGIYIETVGNFQLLFQHHLRHLGSCPQEAVQMYALKISLLLLLISQLSLDFIYYSSWTHTNPPCPLCPLTQHTHTLSLIFDITLLTGLFILKCTVSMYGNCKLNLLVCISKEESSAHNLKHWTVNLKT